MNIVQKLSQFILSKKTNSLVNSMSPEEREERIMYLVNLFRLSFRTDYAYNDAVRGDKTIEPDEYYDECVTLDYGSYARCGSDEEMEGYRADFKELGAEAKFVECCLDYYKDVNTELKFSRSKIESKLKMLAIEETKVLSFDKKKKRWIRNRRRALNEKLELTMRKITEVRQKINELRAELGQFVNSEKQPEINQ